MTWRSGSYGSYEVYFNRDERKTRPPADPPREQALNGVRFLAPTDTAAGGTWLLVNERGLTLAMLNYYERETSGGPDAGTRSRGALLLDLADADSLEAIEDRLRKMDPRPYRAFSLVGVAPSAENGFETARWQYDGEELKPMERNPTMPVCSSSFETTAVIESRRSAFTGLTENAPFSAAIQRKYHHFSGEGSSTAYTVLMNRPDAQTWSISHLRIEPGRADFVYEKLPPDLDGVVETFHNELTWDPAPHLES